MRVPCVINFTANVQFASDFLCSMPTSIVQCTNDTFAISVLCIHCMKAKFRLAFSALAAEMVGGEILLQVRLSLFDLVIINSERK